MRELDAAGIRRDQLSDAVADGAVFRVRQRWYAVPDAPTDVVRAVRVGGAATAASVAKIHGLWEVGTDEVLHVRVHRSASRLKSPTSATGASHDPAANATARANPPAPLDAARDDVCVHYRSDPPIRSGRDPLAVALAEMLHCTPTASVIATVDSALARGEVALAEIRAVAGPSRRRILDRCSDGSESGTETKVRLLLRARNIAHRTQVSIARVGRVDLLVGDRLVIEVDGSRHHSGREEFENDRRRDFELAMRGYVVLRLSYSMVVDEWEVTSRGILALIARGEHRWGVRSAPSVGLDVALRRLDRCDDAPPAAQFAGR
ncbi:DUF559 domain-containing protein [Agromyces sp. H3Y2-19a]|uniref:endonuclease domain-containing protein n=1 Tax=Agromyces chromiiresistens TaxID=3030835 RepID=UPI0023BA2360|nr:DUF559 domain-containing protein [Agromyces chromiiresistens]MDF0513899.1 DUF559 domain-containing protein [Agromyces chromiiresistens]